jgi:hypothetical protein
MLSLETVLLHFRTLLTARGLASHLCGSARGGAVYTLSLALYVSMANDCHVSKLQINRMSLQNFHDLLQLINSSVSSQ